MTSPVIIEAALNGITSRGRNTHVPITVDELVAAYAECYGPVLDARPGTILYPTIGGGASSAERFHHVVELASSGLIRASFLDPGSVNLGGVGTDGLPP